MHAGETQWNLLLTNANNVELESSFQQLALNLRSDAVETDVAVGQNGAGGHGGHLDCGMGGD